MILALVAGPSEVARPPLPLAVVRPARVYRVVRRAAPHELDGQTAVVRGRRVRFQSDVDGWNHVVVRAVGRDGTVLIERSSTGGPTWTTQPFIVRGKRETAPRAFGRKAYLDVYQDAHHYLASYYKPGQDGFDGVFPPGFPPMLLIVDGTHKRIVGQGDFVSWIPGREVVATAYVDARGDLLYREEEGETHTRVFENGRTYDLGKLEFRLRLKDGRSVFGDDAGGLWIWDRGRLLPWVRLPSGWSPVVSDAGDLLVRREDEWTMAILRGTALTPVRFVRPKGSEGLEGRDAHWAKPDGSFQIDGFYGDKEVSYKFVPAP